MLLAHCRAWLFTPAPLSDSTQPVYGSVDKDSQRIAWTIGDKKDPGFETGLPNLTKDDTTMLVHFSKDRTEQSLPGLGVHGWYSETPIAAAAAFKFKSNVANGS